MTAAQTKEREEHRHTGTQEKIRKIGSEGQKSKKIVLKAFP